MIVIVFVGIPVGVDDGFTLVDGFEEGWLEGLEDTLGSADGAEVGFTLVDGIEEGWLEGLEDALGSDVGVEDGFTLVLGFEEGRLEGLEEGRLEGWIDQVGISEGLSDLVGLSLESVVLRVIWGSFENVKLSQSVSL